MLVISSINCSIVSSYYAKYKKQFTRVKVERLRAFRDCRCFTTFALLFSTALKCVSYQKLTLWKIDTIYKLNFICTFNTNDKISVWLVMFLLKDRFSSALYNTQPHVFL